VQGRDCGTVRGGQLAELARAQALVEPRAHLPGKLRVLGLVARDTGEKLA
jgi:hypothetical protein